METQTQTPVFRFKLSIEMVDAILHFSKTHQHDDREGYKEAWTLWKRDEIVAILFNNEFERLKMAGYKGNVESIEDKIFKSGRYYFRNKSLIKAPEKKRSKYIPTSKELILVMDNHIKTHYYNEYSSQGEKTQSRECRHEIKTYTKPSELFIHFYNSHIEMITNEIRRIYNVELAESQNTDVNVNLNININIKMVKMITKIKKTYKNRIFNFCNHL